MYVRKNRKGEYKVDVRCLSYDEYKMLYALIFSSYAKYKETGVQILSCGSFDLYHISPTVFADTIRLDTLAKLLKTFTL